MMSNTQEVLDHHLECFGGGDLDGIMADYDETSIIETQAETVRGLENIRKLFTGMFAEFAKGSSSFDMQRMAVSGDHAFIAWKAQTEDHEFHVGTDTFYVSEGKIAYQSFAAHITPRS